MFLDQQIIAKKYAVAFLNLYLKEISLDVIKKLETLEKFLVNHKQFYISLSIPNIAFKEKTEAISKLVQVFDVGDKIERLIQLLLLQDRIDLLDKVLNQIRFCYKAIHNIKRFKIITSQDIGQEEENILKNFGKFISNSSIIADFFVDPSLIVGVRFQSDALLWECSIRKQLKNIYHELVEKGGSC